MIMKMNWKEEIIQNIKDCGQSLIDNAENIVNNYKYNEGLTITIYPESDGSCANIIVEHVFYPEKIVERYKVR